MMRDVSMQSDHPFDELPEYLRGRAAGEAAIERHLAECAICRSEFDLRRHSRMWNASACIGRSRLAGSRRAGIRPGAAPPVHRAAAAAAMHRTPGFRGRGARPPESPSS
jgi:hypothetical protein